MAWGDTKFNRPAFQPRRWISLLFLALASCTSGVDRFNVRERNVFPVIAGRVELIRSHHELPKGRQRGSWEEGEAGGKKARVRGSGTLEFQWTDGRLVDASTGSVWNAGLGIAVAGPLKGTALRQLPHSSAFDWAWALPHPRSEFYPAPP